MKRPTLTMSSLNYTVKYKKNTGLVMSPTELRDLYFYGVQIRSKDGSEIPTYVWETQIKSAQDEIEGYLGIRFRRQLITETLTFFRDDYINNLPILNTSLPVVKPVTLVGMLNQQQQVRYPIEWLNSYQSSEDCGFARQIHLVPSGSVMSADTNVILVGVMNMYGLRSLPQIPNYWTVQYLTGYCPTKLPYELLDLVGKFAAIKMFHIAGDLILGAGIASQSVSIDGLSQSISSTSSATNAGYGARILGYIKDCKETLARIKGRYRGIYFTVL